jgi:hypothetical protein
MSGTALDHPLVRDYLQELDRALAVLPTVQASELTEQITAHLDDALAPDTTDDQIAAVLSRLGRPVDLAAEAAASTVRSASSSSSTSPSRSISSTKADPARRRRHWRAWTALVATVTVAAGIVAYVLVATSVAPIQARGPSGWWFRQDAARATYVEADGARQTTVPIRSGQLQGLAVTLYNPTDWTQTILGQWQGSNAPGNVERSRITVSTTTGSASNFRSLRYIRPGSIPPHQSRWVRLMWVSNTCLEDKGSGQGNDELRLQIRVGWVDRVENIPLRQGWYVAGPSQGPCD